MFKISDIKNLYCAHFPATGNSLLVVADSAAEANKIVREFSKGKSDYDDYFGRFDLTNVDSDAIYDWKIPYKRILCASNYKKPSYEERIRTLLKKTNTKQRDLSQAFGVTQGTLVSRLKIGKFTFEEQRIIASVTGTEFVAKMVFDDGVECNGDSVRAMLDNALAHINMSITDLYNKSDKKSTCDNFIKRTRTGKYTEQELTELASLIGCTYITYFSKDGSMIA